MFIFAPVASWVGASVLGSFVEVQEVLNKNWIVWGVSTSFSPQAVSVLVRLDGGIRPENGSLLGVLLVEDLSTPTVIEAISDPTLKQQGRMRPAFAFNGAQAV